MDQAEKLGRVMIDYLKIRRLEFQNIRMSAHVLASGCWILDTGCWMLDAGCWILDAGCWILDTGCWILDAGCWILAPVSVLPEHVSGAPSGSERLKG